MWKFAAILCVIASQAFGFEWVHFSPPVGASGNLTNTMSIAYTNYNVSGRIDAFQIQAQSTSVVTIATVAGTGSSFGGSKTIFSGALTANYTTNLVSPIYLWGDTVVMICSNNLVAAGSITNRAGIFLSKP